MVFHYGGNNMINDKGKFKHQYLYLAIITTLFGYIPISHAEYDPSPNLDLLVTDKYKDGKTIDKYIQYTEFSNKLKNLSIKTPGSGSYPNEAISIMYNGNDAVDFAGKTLYIKNIEITAEKTQESKYGGRVGISSLSNNIQADNIKITSHDDGYSGIINKNNENFDNHRDTLSTSKFILKNSEFNLHGDKSNGIYTYKTSINKDSFAHVEVDDSVINTYGNQSTGIKIINASATTNHSEINISGENNIGISVYNTGKALIDNGSTINSESASATGIVLSRFIAKTYWADDLKDDQQVTVDHDSSINVKNGTGIIATAGKDSVNVKNGSSIISKTLIDARKATEDYKNHPTDITLNVSGKSQVEGAVKTEEGTTSTVNLASASVWNVTGDSNLTHLNTDNSSVNFQKDGDKFTTTNVDTLSGNNGTYSFAVDVVKQNGSKLIINKSSDGTHIAQGLNDGAQNTTGQEKITLIEDKSGSNAKAVFSPGKDVELGGYAYQVQRDPNNPDNWILAAKTKPGPDPKPTPNDTAKTITGLASTSYLMNQAEMSTLRQRMGDLTRSAGEAASGDVSGAWGRMYGGNYKTRNNDNLAKADMNYYGFQLGGDVNTVHNGDNKNYLGMFAGHTTGKPDYVRGSATATSWYGGFYDTFIADSGFYVDSVVKLGQYRNKYNLKDSQNNGLHGKAQSSVITLSSQTGKRFILTENDSYNVYAEPQAQLTYSRIGTFNTTASNGLRVRQGAYNSTVGRLGVLLGTQINKQSDIYLKTSYLHEFSKDVKYTLNDSPESYSVKGDGLEAGLGVNVRLNDNGYLYAEGDYINSKTHYTGSKFNIGYRYSF